MIALAKWSVLSLALLSVATTGWAQSRSVADSKVLEIHRRAVANPGDPEALAAYLATLPRVATEDGRTYFVVEGDMLMTRDEVRVHLNARRERSKASSVTPELIVNALDGRPDYWQARASRRLSYAVDRKSFPEAAQYDLIVANMAKAASDWEALCEDCGIKFEHRVEFDSSPSHEKVTFIVKRLDLDGPYAATAFFPSDPVLKRYLYVYPAYFRSAFFDKVGVFRHELGHILGYRHEHTRDVSGCDYEDNQWRRLTDYDPQSVMHYFCGNGGSKELAFTDLDKKGHRELYGSASISKPQSLVLRLEGGEIAENILNLTYELARQKVLATAEHTVQPGDSVCAIYMRVMKFPPKVNCPQKSALKLHAFLNGKGPSQGGLTVGEKILVPQNVNLRQYNYARFYSKDAQADRAQFDADRSKWNVLNVSGFGATGEARVRFVGYEMLVPMPDPATGERALRAFTRFESPNIFVDSTTRSIGSAAHSTIRPSEYLEACRGSGSPGEAAYSHVLGMPKLPACALKCAGPRCSRIFLIDSKVSPNLDLYGAVESGVDFGKPDENALKEAANTCISTGFKREHHGTHLAGIMVSQENGFGFIGLSPGSKLTAVNSSLYTDESVLGDYIAAEMDDDSNTRSKIFVFAGKFADYNSADILTGSGRLKSPELRFSRSQAANRIKWMRPTWITAAGQEDDGNPVELAANSPKAPMNLGDLENVIVVTACDDCSDRKANLLPQSNYSDKVVAVAAPGKAIAGLADSKRVSVTDGSSQATAFVAGVVGAMYNCYPDWYQTAKVRRRLMLTARPSLSQAEYDKVQSGIVNPELALLDPQKSWIRLKGGAISEANIAGWCAGSFTMSDFFRDVTSRSETYPIADIRRITLYPRAEAAEPPQWVFFHNTSGPPPYDIGRSKPGRANTSTKILQLGDSSVVTLGEIEELLLAAPIRRQLACK